MILPLLLAAAATPPVPAGPVDRLHKIVVDAIRNCPEHAPGEIVVCARDHGFAEGYRLPRLDPRFAGGGVPAKGRGSLADAGIGAAGTGSCSATGSGGATGCSLREENNWGDWKRQARADGRQFPW